MNGRSVNRHSCSTHPFAVTGKKKGSSAVGDVCLRFFDEHGELVDSSLNGRVVGISVDELRAVPRKVGIAGGPRKHRAIRAAALGGWIDVFITDVTTAEYLVSAR